MLAVPLRATALVSQSADITVSGNSLRKSHTPLQRAVGEPVSHLRSCNSSFEDSSPLIPRHVIMCLIDRFLIHSIVGGFLAVSSSSSRGLQWESVMFRENKYQSLWHTTEQTCRQRWLNFKTWRANVRTEMI